MATRQGRPKRKASGGRYIANRKKRTFDLGRRPTFTKIAERKVKEVKMRSGSKKTILLSCDVANVFDGSKCKKVKIQNILENPANRHFVRRNILTKGSVIDTDKGKAKITSRPGQEGMVNAVLV